MIFYLYGSTGSTVDYVGNILPHKASGWLSPCCRSLFDPQHCQYRWFYQMQKRCANLL